jgi:hypothetical protein
MNRMAPSRPSCVKMSTRTGREGSKLASAGWITRLPGNCEGFLVQLARAPIRPSSCSSLPTSVLVGGPPAHGSFALAWPDRFH